MHTADVTADVLGRVASWLPGGDLTPWLVVAGAVALFLAWKAVRFGMRIVSLGIAAVLFLGAGPASTWSAPDLPFVGPGTDQPPPPPAGDARSVPPPPDAFSGVVTAVGDGDSLRVRVTQPGGTPAEPGAELEVRLLRIDAPELGRDGERPHCLADEAADALARIVPPGTEVRGAYDLERRDRYDRDLVHLWSADGRWVNGAMLSAGLARVVTVDPNTGYEDDVRALEAAAREGRRGVWDPAVCPA